MQKNNKLSLFIRVTALLLLSVLSTLVNAQAQTTITSLQQITNPAGSYIITDDINAAVFDTPIADFTGTLTSAPKQDGTFPVISNLNVPIFTTATDATISNIILDAINISYSSSVGAICCTANGATRIYNCGILSGEIRSTGNSTANNSTDCCGSLVGLLDGTARVINCYSFANITGGNRVGGIVGYNNYKTTAANIRTLVMNCMFYGDITDGNKVSPIYGGEIINNLNSGGLNTFNYYAYDRLKTKAITEGMYNCALAVEERYLTRFEFYRLMLNSNRSLAAYYASTLGNTVSADDMAKWVMETADKSISDPKPYPILKKKGKYPSIINYDVENAPSSSSTERNKGKKLGALTVNINLGSGYPEGASITTSQLILDRTDKDFDRFNFNYDKVQLPYYNDVGTNNCTDNKVVTGWKITAITAVTDDPYTSANYPTIGVKDFPDHNYADRKSSNKDLYSVSKRVFSQGAYFDVPYGVESITIEPYWGKAAYVSDEYRDVVYNTGYGSQNVSQLGKVFGGNGTSVQINGNSQKVYTSIGNALNNLSGVTNPTVYDYAVVLVGNLHHSGSTPSGGDKPFTIMSIDLDKDNEPDCSFIYNHNSRGNVSPIRFDFINVIGTAQAQKPNGANEIRNTAIFRNRGWFEITNTALMYFSQFEYEDTPENGASRADAPLILLGGVFDQFTSTQNQEVTGKTIYIHVGSNVWIKNFGPGTHSDGNRSTAHVPVSVTGGDYEGFYLTGTYNANAAARTDNAECYISGGRFGEAAGASMEQIKGNVRWQIYDADITEFFGGGINDDKPITGTITTEIFNSHVELFCGGPKFGNMTAGKDVTTTAQGCTFGKFFGAGYGGNSFSRKKYVDDTNYNWNTYQGYYTTDRGKYFNGTSTATASGKNYGYKGPGVAVDFDYEFFVWTSGKTGGRFFVKFVTFSLAQCGNVESQLTDCTINGDFYGGGSLGKVTGTAKSTLDGCTVNGNVFGGGYSATTPKIPVRRSGFAQVPNYNKSSGMFEPGVFSEIDYYEWKHVDNYPANGASGGLVTENGKNYVITTADLEALGQVANTDLTITGNTKVAGSVFGGGDQSETLGNTDVKVQTVDDNPNYTIGYVFGGGNVANVGGNVKVTMTSGTVLNDVYGGGAKANTNIGNNNNPKPNPLAETIVDLNGGLVQGDVYGGGLGNADTAALVWGDATVTLNGTKFQHTGHIFGGNNINGTPKGHIKVDIRKTADNGQSIDLDAVFGGGNMAAYEPSDPDDYAEVLIEKANAQDRLYVGDIYGGGNEADVVAGTSITLLSGIVNGGIYGGCNSQGTVSGPIQVNIYGNVGQSDSNVDIFGGGYGEATATSGNVTVNIGDLTSYNPVIYGDIYGGSALGSVNDAQDFTMVNVMSGQIHGNIFGGGLGESGQDNASKGQVNGTVIVNIGATDGQQTPAYTGNATLYGSVYGCNNTNGSPQGNVTVNIYSTAHTTTDAVGYTADDGTNGAPTYAIANVFGGGRQADYTPSSDQSRATVYIHGCSNTIEDLFGGGDAAAAYGVVTVVDGGRFHRIFGGGNGENVPADIGAGGTDLQVHGGNIGQLFGGSNTNGVITGPMNTTVDSDGPCGQVDIEEFFCGNNLASIGTAQNPTSIVATIGCGTIFGDVYGGCNLADIYGDITLNIEGGTIGRVFGGSKGGATAANIYGNVTLNITGGDIDNAFGGSNINGNISGSIQVNVNKGADPCVWNIGNIYGASNDATYSPTADGNSLTVNIMNGNINGSVYGGGKGATATVTANPAVVIGDGNAEHSVIIAQNVYGGGDAAAVDGNTQVTYNDNNAAGHVDNLFGGGNAAGVSGTATVNMMAGTITTGIYGGCNSVGDVAGAIQVNIYGGTLGSSSAHMPGGIFGGGYGQNTTTSGNVTVTIGDLEGNYTPVVYADIYGGSALGNVNNDAQDITKVEFLNGTLHGKLYGGGLGSLAVEDDPDTQEDESAPAIAAKVMGQVQVNIGADGQSNCAIDLSDASVFGCNNTNGSPQDDVTVTVWCTAHNSTYGIDQVFGGGNRADYAPENGLASSAKRATVNVMGCLNTIRRLFGGGNAAAATGVAVTINGGTFEYVFGGGNGEVKAADIGDGGTDLQIHGGHINMLFGGSNASGTITGQMGVNIDSEGGCPDEMNIEEFFCGNNLANIGTADNPVDINATIGCGTKFGAVYGGCNLADIYGNVTLTIEGGTMDYVYGGSKGRLADNTDPSNPIEAKAANINGDVILNIYGGQIGDAFGGSNINGNITGSITVNMDWSLASTDCNTDLSLGNVYGGSNLAAYAPTTAGNYPAVNIYHGTVTHSVFGGGKGATAVVTSNPIVTIGDDNANHYAVVTENVYGGGDAAAVTGNTRVLYNDNNASSTVNNLFGGGNAAGVSGTATVTLTSGKVLTGIYGGCNASGTVGGAIALNINGGLVGTDANNRAYGIFGGGKGSDTRTGDAVTVTIGTATDAQTYPTIYGDVYGGSAEGQVNDDLAEIAKVWLKKGVINGDLYGGGFGDNGSNALVNGSVQVVVDGGTVTGKVFGANNANGTPLGSVTVTINGTDTPQSGYALSEVYGGGNMANYNPTNITPATVVVNGCDNSIGVVYGGGNAADVPGTDVTIWGGTIGQVFGGGHGNKDATPATEANVVKRGDEGGNVAVKIYGGTITEVFGGSNSKGNIEGASTVTIEENGGSCTFNIGDVYGGGNQAAGNAGTLSIGCGAVITGNVYGGAKEANVNNDIHLEITGGTLHNVFGGNNKGGTIAGTITVDINQDNSCSSWHVDNVYGGGNLAAYSAPQDNQNYPAVNIKNGTVSGSVFGGGYGASATVTANPQVTVTGGTITQDVFGGGEQAPVSGNPTVLFTGGQAANVYGGGKQANVTGNNTVRIEGGTVTTDVYGGGMQGDVSGKVTVNISKSGTPGTVVIGRDVYGGGALANTNTGNIDSETTMTTNRNVTVVNLYPGATIGHDVYGGGRGQKASGADPGIEAIVYGNVSVYQYGAVLTATYNSEGLATGGRIFGGNNVNGTPKGHILVYVNKTTGNAAQQRSSADARADADATHTYELAAVYGGGNEAEYNPYSNTDFAEVQIDGCNDVSIHSVYGGGNAASTPATKVTIGGAYEIEYVFGGGNGAGTGNPGANVGYHAYGDDHAGITQEDIQYRLDHYKYGTGVATTNIYGGRIHHIYGGSNTRGNVRETAVAMLDEVNACPLVVDGIYGGGREAYMEGKASLEMGCITGMGEIYGGSEKADVGNDVELTLTSGHFGKVFGGNNKGGRIYGSIKVNIEQTGCVPITIDELYLGGNNAPYSVYGYTNQSYTVDIDGESVTHYHLNESGTRLYADPELNIRSFESIGNVYGGGKGKPATMVGNPNIDINVTQGWVNGKYVGVEPAYTRYKQKPGILPADGVIDTVYGGGNAADVIGNPAIRIGDKMGSTVTLKSMQSLHDNLPAGGETKNGITIEKPASGSIKYTAADNDSNTITVEVSQTVKGATISGNVYGGGNQADVTGNTNIQVGPAQ